VKNFKAMLALRSEAHQALVDSLGNHYGPEFSEMLLALGEAERLIKGMLNRVNEVSEPSHEVQSAAMGLMRYLADRFGEDSGAYASAATITFGLNPAAVFHALQAAQGVGMRGAVEAHRDGCDTVGCTAPESMASFLTALEAVTQGQCEHEPNKTPSLLH
jgi:hypothetical protein